MRIIGIDPGVARTGFGVIDAERGRVRHRTSGCIVTSARRPHPERLAALAVKLRALLRRQKPDLAAVERLFFTKNTSTAMAVGEARGVALAILAEAGVRVAEFTPSAVKSAVAAYGRADKRQVQTMVKLLLELPAVPEPDDAADALAVALTAAAMVRPKR